MTARAKTTWQQREAFPAWPAVRKRFPLLIDGAGKMNPKNFHHMKAMLPLFATPVTSIQIAERTGRTTLSVQRTIRRMSDHGLIRPAGWGAPTGRGPIPIAWIAVEVPA